jgi:hypothetical protein
MVEDFCASPIVWGRWPGATFRDGCDAKIVTGRRGTSAPDSALSGAPR